MEQDGYVVLNGFQIDSIDCSELEARLAKRFEESDAESKGFLTRDQVLAAFREESAELLLLPGVTLPEDRLSAAFQAQLEDEIDKEQFFVIIEKSLVTLAGDLKDKPIVTSRLDGSAIREVFEDEDDFAVLAENLFTKLDLDENGKLSKSELQPALLQLGVELGIPTPAGALWEYALYQPEAQALLDELFKKHGAEGSQEIGQTKFAQLLQDMLVDLADSLKAKPVIVVHEGLDLSKFTKTPVLEEIIADQAKLDQVTEAFFRGLDVNSDGKLSKEEIKPLFMLNSQGLPLMVAHEQAEKEINTVFPDQDAQVPGEISKSAFKDFMEGVLETYVSNEKAAEEGAGDDE